MRARAAMPSYILRRDGICSQHGWRSRASCWSARFSSARSVWLLSTARAAPKTASARDIAVNRRSAPTSRPAPRSSFGKRQVAICSLLDPEAILFGGGTSDAGEALLERIRQRVPPRLLLRARLLLAGLGSDSRLYGALWGAAKAANLASPDARRATSPKPAARRNKNGRPQAVQHRWLA